MRKILPIILCLFSLLTYAQPPRGAFAANGRLYGKILDAATRQPVEFSSVTLLALKKDSLIAGCLARPNGDFAFENLPFGEYRMRVFFIGFSKLEQKVTLSAQEQDKDIGNILLQVDSKLLNEVAITDHKSTLQLSIDRKIYNVSKDISTKGGTGLDAVKNIPSVTVDADGNVSLRNNSVQVYIDGRPSSMTLGQIPADQIEQVEIISNPSAKFDAGTTGGILNVILKKNAKPGYNGVASAGIGTNNRYNAMFNLNVRVGRFNLFGMYNFSTQQNNNGGFTNRKSILLPSPDPITGAVNQYYRQTSVVNATDNFQFARAGLDFLMNNRNSFTLNCNMVQGSFENKDNQTYTYADTSNINSSTGKRLNSQQASFTRLSAQLLYRHTFPKQGKELSSDITVNTRTSDGKNDYTTHSYTIQNVEYPLSPSNQKSNANASGWNYTWQLDFTNPLSAKSRFESGARSYFSKESNQLTTYNRDSNGNYIAYFDMSNNYDITSAINAAYINYISVFAGINYQAGLRFEETFYKGSIINKNLNFSYFYPGNGLSNLGYCFFPAIYLSKKLKNNQELQLNFSRKINRPNFFQLMPFIMFADNANIRIGNPGLAPEFVNISELNYNKVYKKINILSSFYFRYTENPITTIAYPLESNPNILVNTFKNGKNSFTYGTDQTLKASITKSFDITANANVFYTNISYNNGIQLINNTGFSWTGKGMLAYRFPMGFNAQLNGTYQAPQIIPQGITRVMQYMDISLAKNIKQKITFTLLLSDVFNSKRMGTDYVTADYTQQLSRRRETRYLKFTITYTFGKLTAIKKPKPKQGENMGNQDGLDF